VTVFEVVAVILLADTVAGYSVLFVWQTLTNYKIQTSCKNAKINDLENERIARQFRRLLYSENHSKTIQLCAFHVTPDCRGENKKYLE
jgi:hypothetical protein